MSAYKQENLIGQLSIFDIPVIEKPKNITKVVEKITETKVLSTNIHEISQDQQNVINKYKSNVYLNLIIHYGGGGVGIELRDNENFETIYVNRQGKEEFKWSKQLAVMDMDKVILDNTTIATKSNVGELAKAGDFVKAYYGKRIIEGPIVREYGLGNSILNINFEMDGISCQTAIGRHAVIEILKEAI
ncbi:hypothetical protein [Clostridium pasteurianum]|uniref:Uncharacterized protein n=1 Tax=Clostridium pasteurianum BC1 TaxID=86416 RepID=R4JYK9_CLOPA|nr:hypothetical protein [Clostridium pasteurianum]AGK95383.1 hypothetical protein Clopa_0321 [Clostridium pasteurianum BC1]